MAKNKPTFKEKVEQFKQETKSSGFSSRSGFEKLVDLLYGEIEQIKKSAKDEKPAAKKETKKEGNK